MSRIYEDKALANRPVIPESVPGGWEPAQMQRGPGVVLEGKLRAIKVEPAGQTDKISAEDLKQLINKPELIKISEKHTPSHSLAFWILEGEMENIELEVEDGLRLKTLGDSPFIFSLAKMDAGTVAKCNFAGGEKVGTSWTDNVFAAKCKTEQEAKTSTQGEGVDEDEWDD
ncbi:hypothetical protein chiPu_0016964 [Chiloscyllium punctatum]|uniref:Arpin n=1 Tax=Chiloscyllium punctatum TaxID=137246 RepID=A0A401T739_CHIPU|nr:hypothetical protein [Chiloscyllium punctatum]